jgi:hypothetical protein
MDHSCVSSCPQCGGSLEQGFAARAAGLSFVAPGKLEHQVFLDEDISQAGLKKLLPSKAEYYRSFLCRSCKLYIIDYSRTYSRDDAEEIVRQL